MPRRKVSVELELDAVRYLAASRQVTTATKMSEEAIEDLGDEADETGTDLDQLAANAVVAAGRIDDVGDEATQTAAALAVLDSRIDATKRSIRELSVAMAFSPGDIGLADRLRGERSELGMLNRLRRVITPEDAQRSGAQAGASFGSGFIEGIGSLPSTLRGSAIAAIAVLIADLAPLLGGGIAGIITGAVGVGGIAGGIASAGKDQRVREAARAFAGDISREFFSGGPIFVEPTVRALETLRVAFHDLNLGETFAIAAPYVDDVAEGLANMAREFMPGFTRALAAAGPVMSMLGTQLGETGAALGDVLAVMAESEGAAGAFQATLDIVEDALLFTAGALAALGEGFRTIVDVSALFATFGKNTIGWIPGLGTVVDNVSASFEKWQGTMDVGALHTEGNTEMFRRYGGAIGLVAPLTQHLAVNEKELAAQAKDLAKSQKDAADAVRDYNRAVDDAISTAARLDASEDSVRLSMMDLTQSVKDNGKVWGDNTRAGLENRAALARALTAIDNVRRAQIDSGIDAQTANVAYNKQIAVLEALGVKLGLTKQRIADLIGDKRINIITTFITRGRWRLPSGDFRVSGGGRLIEGEGTMMLSAAPRAILRQHGGPVGGPFGDTFVVGEGGRPEVLELAPGARGFVHPSAAAFMAAQHPAPMRLEVHITGADNEFVKLLRRIVRIEGAGDVQAALGRT